MEQELCLNKMRNPKMFLESKTNRIDTALKEFEDGSVKRYRRSNLSIEEKIAKLQQMLENLEAEIEKLPEHQ